MKWPHPTSVSEVQATINAITPNFGFSHGKVPTSLVLAPGDDYTTGVPVVEAEQRSAATKSLRSRP